MSDTHLTPDTKHKKSRSPSPRKKRSESPHKTSSDSPKKRKDSSSRSPRNRKHSKSKKKSRSKSMKKGENESTRPRMVIPHAVNLIAKASDLPNTDSGVLGDVSDPYYVLSYKGDEIGRSEVINNDLNPTWESLYVDLTGLKKRSVIDIIVKDKDMIGNTHLATGKVTVGDLLKATAENPLDIPMENISGKKGTPVFTLAAQACTIDQGDFHKKLNNAFLFAFPENADQKSDRSEIDDFAHQMKQVTELQDDHLLNLDGIVDLVEMFFKDLWSSLFHCKQIGSPIYRLSVFHDRHEPFVSQFMGHILGLRMELGQKKTKNLYTDIGDVYRDDHILFSVKEVNDNFADKVGFEAEHVEMITATRYRGFRFAPISLLFVYRHKDDPEPAYHLVESGTGVSNNTGLIYYGEAFDVPQVSQLGFKPTPYTSKYNYYHHTTTKNGRDPTQVKIESYQPEKDAPYITVTIDYIRLDDPDDPNDTIDKDEMISPAGATMVALQRLYTLADGFGCLPEDAVVGKALAEGGRKQEWITQPPVNICPVPH